MKRLIALLLVGVALGASPVLAQLAKPVPIPLAALPALSGDAAPLKSAEAAPVPVPTDPTPAAPPSTAATDPTMPKTVTVRCVPLELLLSTLLSSGTVPEEQIPYDGPGNPNAVRLRALGVVVTDYDYAIKFKNAAFVSYAFIRDDCAFAYFVIKGASL